MIIYCIITKIILPKITINKINFYLNMNIFII